MTEKNEWTCGICKLNGSCKDQDEIIRRTGANPNDIGACDMLLEEVGFKGQEQGKNG